MADRADEGPLGQQTGHLPAVHPHRSWLETWLLEIYDQSRVTTPSNVSVATVARANSRNKISTSSDLALELPERTIATKRPSKNGHFWVFLVNHRFPEDLVGGPEWLPHNLIL